MALNQYTELLFFIKSLGEADPFVNTITQGEIERIDLAKGNIFPLLHIIITGASFTNGQTVVFNVELAALQQRDINNEESTDKFFQQDNEVDNLNEMLAVLNRIWTNMLREFADNNIIASEDPTLEIVTQYKANLLDGWILSFDVTVPNTTLSLCP